MNLSLPNNSLMYHLPVCSQSVLPTLKSLKHIYARLILFNYQLRVTDFSNKICHTYKLGFIHIELCNIKYEERSNFTNKLHKHLKVFTLKE